MQWFHVDTSSPKINWKEHHVSLYASLFWILLISAMHYLLNNNYIHLSHLTILHILTLINAFLRAARHILELIPPFIDENEHILDDHGFSFLIGLLQSGLVYPVSQLLFISFTSEHQAGQLFALP